MIVWLHMVPIPISPYIFIFRACHGESLVRGWLILVYNSTQGYGITIYSIIHFSSYYSGSDVTHTVGSIIAPDQKWISDNWPDIYFKIDEVNNKTATFAGTFRYVEENGMATKFPLRGKFDPQGLTIGWIVSFWNKHENDYVLVTWVGRLKINFSAGPVLRAVIYATRTIAHDSGPGTDSDQGSFSWNSPTN